MELKQGFKQTDIGLFPRDWSIKKLKEITTLLTNGFVGSAKIHYSENDSDVLYIQGYNVLENSFDFHGIKHVTRSFHSQHQKSSLLENDLLTVQTGDVGLTTIVPKGLVGSNCHALIITRYKKNLVDSKYISFFLNSKQGRMRLKLIETGTTMKHLNCGDMLEFQLPLPPLTEQTAIANALSDMDALISQTEKVIEKKKAIKQGAMQELLKPKEGWVTKKLGDVAKFLKGSGLPKADLTEDGRYRCIHYGELFTFYKENIDNIKSRTNKNFGAFLSNINDVLMPTSDVTPNGLATASCINENNIVLGGDILVIRSDSNKIDGVFLSYSIKFNRQQIMKLVSGSTVYHLYGSDMSKFIFSFPELKIQQGISRLLIDMEDEINKYQTKLTKLKQQKQGMMQALLTGKIRLVS